MWELLSKQNRPIVLYGMGDGADKILAECERRGITVSGVFASDGFVREKRFHGFSVCSYAACVERFGDFTVLLCFGSALPEVMEHIERIERERELYAPDVPVVGSGIFDRQYAAAHRERLQWVYERLADEQSRRVFECCVRYRVSGQLKYLRECASPEPEVYESIIELRRGGSFLDLGAYNGDTLQQYAARLPDYRQIVALEPAAANYKKLVRNTEGMQRLCCINAAVHDEDGELRFSIGGRSAARAAKGRMVRALTVDSLTRGGFSPNFIKLDVEGNEAAALRGAADTIKHTRPQLLVSAYHRTEDYFALPELVLGLREDYRVYMRHHPYYPAWDTAFYFV